MPAIISGTLELKIKKIEDQFSMMTHLKQAVCEQWKISEDEFFDMLANYVSDPESGCHFDLNSDCPVCGWQKEA